MIKEDIRFIISNAIIYPEFREFFFKNASKSKEKFSLTDNQYEKICSYIADYSYIFETDQAKTQAFAL